MTDDHFAKAVQNPVQQPAVLPRTGSQTDYPQMKQPPVVQGVAGGCTKVRNPLAGVDGNRPENDNHLSGHDLQVEAESENAEYGAIEVIPHPDSNLTRLIEVWDSLPSDTRTAILAIVEAAQGR